MPFVSVTTSKKLSQEQFISIKSKLGQSISVIATKVEAGTMIKIDDCQTFYKGGIEQEAAAFVEVRLFGEAVFEEKKAFTDVIFKTLLEVAGIEPAYIYINFLEFNVWGSNGNLNSK